MVAGNRFPTLPVHAGGQRAMTMKNPHEQEVENRQVRVGYPECRTHFHERVHCATSG